MDEVEVTVRMPRDVFDAAVTDARSWGVTADVLRRSAANDAADGLCSSAAEGLLRAAMLEHIPPWEPTEEQVRAYMKRAGWYGDSQDADDAKEALIAAYEVLRQSSGPLYAGPLSGRQVA